MCEYDISRADPGDRVEVDEPIAQIETDKVLLFHNHPLFSLVGLKSVYVSNAYED